MCFSAYVCLVSGLWFSCGVAVSMGEGPHSTVYIPHSTIYTLDSTLYTLPSKLYPLHFTLLTPHSRLYTPHSTLYTPHSSFYTLHSTLYTLHSTLRLLLINCGFSQPCLYLCYMLLWWRDWAGFVLGLAMACCIVGWVVGSPW